MVSEGSETIRLYHCTYLTLVPLILRYGFYHAVGRPTFTDDERVSVNVHFGHRNAILVFDVPRKLIDETGLSLSSASKVKVLPNKIKKGKIISDILKDAETNGCLGRIDASFINFQETLTVNRKLVKMFDRGDGLTPPITSEEVKYLEDCFRRFPQQEKIKAYQNRSEAANPDTSGNLAKQTKSLADKERDGEINKEGKLEERIEKLAEQIEGKDDVPKNEASQAAQPAASCNIVTHKTPSLDKIIIMVLAKDRKLLDRLLLSKEKIAHRVEDIILDLNIDEKDSLIKQLTDRVYEIELKDEKEKTEIDLIIVLVHKYIIEFISRRQFISLLGGMLFDVPSLKSEIASGLVSVFIPMPAGLGMSDLSELARAHWERGEYAQALAAETYVRGRSIWTEEFFAKNPTTLRLAIMGDDADQKLTSMMMRQGKVGGLTVYDKMAKDTDIYGLGMSQEAFDTEVQGCASYYRATYSARKDVNMERFSSRSFSPDYSLEELFSSARNSLENYLTRDAISHVKSIGSAFREAGRIEEAEAWYKQLGEIGNAFTEEGNLELARECRGDPLSEWKTKESLEQWKPEAPSEQKERITSESKLETSTTTEESSPTNPSIESVPDTETISEQRFVRNLERPEELAKNLVESVLSLSLNKKVVLAFGEKIGTRHGSSMLAVAQALEELKENEDFKELIKYLEIIRPSTGRSSSPYMLPSKLEGFIKNGYEIFIFADVTERDELKGLEDRAHSVYIDETGFPPDVRYPLPEIVTIRLAQAIDPRTLEEIRGSLERLNIKSIEPDGAALIFSLLPEAKQHDMQKPKDQDELIKDLILKAA